MSEVTVDTARELARRPLMDSAAAGRLEAVFKVLANDTRLRMLHALIRSGELTVTQLSEAVGLRPQAVSNQLQRMVDRRVLSSRRAGNHVWYRVSDPCVTGLIDLAWCMSDDEPA